MDQVTIGLLGFAAVSAAWDGVRRYIDMRRFNQATLDEMARIENEHNVLAQKVQALTEKVSFSSAGIANRTPRIGGR